MEPIEMMEKIETIVENWQAGDIDSDEALVLIDELVNFSEEDEYAS